MITSAVSVVNHWKTGSPLLTKGLTLLTLASTLMLTDTKTDSPPVRAEE